MIAWERAVDRSKYGEYSANSRLEEATLQVCGDRSSGSKADSGASGSVRLSVSRALFTIAICSALSGCYVVSTVDPDGARVRHYFGYVRVIVPATHSGRERIVSSDISGAGIRFEDGMLMGLFRDKTVVVPLDCRFVMLVRDREQLDRALTTLSTKFSREDLCLAVQ